MNFVAKFRKNLKYLKLRDVASMFIFLLAYFPALILKLWFKVRKKKVWLIAESPDTARDNGYHFFKYVTKNHSEILTYYAIEKNSADRSKVAILGRTVDYGSFKHWLLYLAANENISTQKSGNPAPPLFYLLHNYGLIKNNRIFLQHGIIKDNLKWLYYNETKFKLFICGAKAEYDYIKKNFGYPKGSVVYTGLARFDNLSTDKKNPKQILVMPTWRNWLGRETNLLEKNKQSITKAAYFSHWISLLSNIELANYLESNNITLYFYPHFNMQKYVSLFKTKTKNIKIVTKEDIDIQDLLNESSLLVTDYSSIFFDFAYTQKPILYYQFDEREFRERQYEEGYFSYRKDGFGPVVDKEDRLVKKMIGYMNANYRVEKKYKDNSDEFFQRRDQYNSERIYKAILKSEKKA